MTVGAWKRDYREKVVIDDPSVSRFDTLQDVKIAHRRLAKQATVVETSVNSGVGQINLPKSPPPEHALEHLTAGVSIVVLKDGDVGMVKILRRSHFNGQQCCLEYKRHDYEKGIIRINSQLGKDNSSPPQV